MAPQPSRRRNPLRGCRIQRSAQHPDVLTYLPAELLHEIVSYFDPIADRGTFATLMRVSSTFWDIAAPSLYRDLKLDNDQLHLLVSGGLDPNFDELVPTVNYMKRNYLRRLGRRGGSKLSIRSQRAFAFIQRLHLYPPPLREGILELWDATLPYAPPLFANVRHLLLEDDPERRDSTIWWGNFTGDPEDETVLFNRVKICVRGPYSERCAHSFAGNATEYTYHGPEPEEVRLPRHWGSLRFFQTQFSEYAAPHAAWLDERLGTQHAKNPAVQVYLQIPLAHMHVEAQILERIDKRYDWRLNPPSKLHLVYDNDCAPCVVCGESHVMVNVNAQDAGGTTSTALPLLSQR